jgi:hypothetical protein
MAKTVIGSRLQEEVAALQRLQKGIAGSKKSSDQMRAIAKLAAEVNAAIDQESPKT